MAGTLPKRYARKLSPDQKSLAKDNAWHITPHGVYHPHRPGKSRVVFDYSDKCMGKSLNDMLFKGSVACWSPLEVSERESGSYGGHRDHVLPSGSSKSSQFLSASSLVGGWQYGARIARIWDGCSLVGAISSPAWVNLELRKTPENNHHSLPPTVIKRVRRHFYMDDCLKSLPAEQKAVEHVSSLSTLLSRGGFKLTKWVSNSRDVV